MFSTKHWSVVVMAARGTPASAEALEQLCRSYWYPLYAFVRRQGRSPQEMQDFFAHLLSNSFPVGPGRSAAGTEMFRVTGSEAL